MQHGVLEWVRRLFLRKRRWWVIFGLALVPLVAMLCLQVLWLVNLEKTSSDARRLSIRNYADFVDEKVSHFFRKTAGWALDVPANLLGEDEEQVVEFFRERSAKIPEVHGYHPVDTLFVTSSEGRPGGGTVLFFDVKTLEPTMDVDSGLLNAVFLAESYWQVLSEKVASLDVGGFTVDERQRPYRLVMKPIIDVDGAYVGLAGMALNRPFLTEALFPTVFSTVLPEDEKLGVMVRDGKGELACRRWGERKDGDWLQNTEHASRRLSFVFQDWEIVVVGEASSIKQWARTNLIFNISLALILALAMALTVGLALRAASREMHLSGMKNEFVSNVSHELRTPVAAMRSFGELLRSGRVEDPERVREYGQFIETESIRLTALINNILDFSKIESGKKSYRVKEIRVDDLLNEIQQAFQMRLEARGMPLSVENRIGQPAVIHADQGAMMQALHNLLDNAVKYSKDNPSIVVRAERRGSWLVISVEDHGIGIPSHERERVFERFHRVETRGVHNVKGSGLGLSIVKHIVEAHGGEVQLKSEEGKGSTFSLLLPFEGEGAHDMPDEETR